MLAAVCKEREISGETFPVNWFCDGSDRTEMVSFFGYKYFFCVSLKCKFTKNCCCYCRVLKFGDSLYIKVIFSIVQIVEIWESGKSRGLSDC